MRHKIEIKIALVEETIINKVPRFFDLTTDWRTTYIIKDSKTWFDRPLHTIMSDFYTEMLAYITPDCFETQFKVNLIETLLETNGDGLDFEYTSEIYKFSIENKTTCNGEVYDNYWKFIPKITSVEIIPEKNILSLQNKLKEEVKEEKE